MNVLQSLDMQSDSWGLSGAGWRGQRSHSLHVSVAQQGGVLCPRSLFSQRNVSWSLHSGRNASDASRLKTNTNKLVKQREIYFPLSSRITGWRPRIWRLSLTSWMHRPRTCRTSSRAGGAAAITTGEPPASCPTTFSPPWWTWSLQPKASWRGSTGEICKEVHLWYM